MVPLGQISLLCLDESNSLILSQHRNSYSCDIIKAWRLKLSGKGVNGDLYTTPYFFIY